MQVAQLQSTETNGSAPVGNPIFIAGYDSIGNAVRRIAVDSTGRIITASESAAAATSGFSKGIVSTASLTDVPVRESTYNEQSSNAARSFSSSSASDTSAGVGARQITLTYYTSTGDGPFTEIVTLNGTSAVNTTSSTICFIENIIVTSAGSTGSNVGTITMFISTGGGGGTLATMTIGTNTTLWAHHYVPITKTCYITGISGHNNNSTNGSILSIRKQSIGGTGPLIAVSDYVRCGNATPQTTRNYGTPINIVGPAKVILYVTPEGSLPIITRASFDFYDQ